MIQTITKLIPVLLLTILQESFAQQAFQRFYGSSNYEEGNSIIKLSDDNLLMACAQSPSVSGNNRNILLIKADENGDEIWTKVLATSFDEVPRAVIQTTDSGFAIVGSMYGNSAANNEQVFLIKTDQNGIIQWSKTYGGTSNERGFTLQQTGDGGYILGGSITSGSNGNEDAYFIKTDEFGDIEWSKSMGGFNTDNNFDIHPTGDGGYIFTGSQGSYGSGPFDYWLVKLTATGDLDWAKAYGGSDEEHSRIVHEANDGGYIIMGHTTTWGAGNWDILMIKTDENGNEEWSRVYGGPAMDFAGDFTATGDAYYISAFSESYGSGRDFLLMKIDNSGNLEWAKNYGFPGDDIFPFGSQNSIIKYDSQSLFMIGKVSSGQLGSSDIFLQKMNLAGESSCNFQNVNPAVVSPGIITVDVDIPVNNNGTSQTINFTNADFDLSVLDYCLPPIADFSSSDTIICEGTCIDFNDNSFNDPSFYSWTFEGGSPGVSNAVNPQNICYPNSGIFEVRLIVSNLIGSDTAYQTIVVQAAPEINLGADTTLCIGQTLTLSITEPGINMIQWSTGSTIDSITITDPGLYSVVVQNDNCFASDQIEVDFNTPMADLGPDQSICEGESVVLSSIHNGATYVWQDGSMAETYLATEEGWYSVEISIGDCSATDSMFLTVNPIPSLELGVDTTICPGTVVNLDAFFPGASYAWNDGSANGQLTVSQPGIYAVVVSLGECTATDEIAVDVLPSIEISIPAMDTTLCLGFETTLNAVAENADILTWSDGSVGSGILVTETGIYTVSASNDCETLVSNGVSVEFEDCNCNFEVPNAFTPNFDGVNDYFQPVSNCEILDYNIKIFGRWGEFIYESRAFDPGWDGTFHGKSAPSTVYVYLIEAQIMRNGVLEFLNLAGDVTLIR